MSTKPDHTVSRAIAGSSIPASLRDHFVRRVETLETDLYHRRREVDVAAKRIDELELQACDLREQLRQKDAQLADARNHRDSLADMLERRRLECVEGTEAPMFSHGLDQRPSRPPPPRDHLEGWLDPKATHDPR